MYNIGVISISGSLENEYIKILEENHSQLVELSPQEIDEDLDNLDAMIINGDREEDVPVICNVLLKLKTNKNPLVWVLTKESTSMSRVIFLQFGADGNLTYKENPYEFQLVIKNAIERQKQLGMKTRQTYVETEVLEAVNEEETEPLQLCESNMSVIVNGNEVALTRLEFKTLSILFEQPNTAFTYEELFEKLWGGPYKDQAYRVANLIFHLRKKLDQYSEGFNFIKTVRSKGYMLDLQGTK